MNKNRFSYKKLLVILILALGLQISPQTNASDFLKSATIGCAKLGLKAGVLTGAGLLAYRNTPEFIAKTKAKIDSNELVAKLGYNPKFENLPKNENDNTPRLLTAAGLNGLGNERPKKLHSPGVLEVVKYLHANNANTLPFRSLGLGGTHDALTFLYGALKCADAGCPMDWKGTSRGAATCITSAHAVEFPHKHKWLWKTLEATEGPWYWKKLDVKRIKKIKKLTDTVYIDNPFLALTETPLFININEFFGLFLPHQLSKITPLSVQKCIPSFIQDQQTRLKITEKIAKFICIVFTKMDWTDPIDRLRELRGKGWKFEIGTMLKNDHDVGNRLDPELIRLCEEDSDWNYHNKNMDHLDDEENTEKIRKKYGISRRVYSKEYQV